MTIDEATVKGVVEGTEKIPVSDSGSPKSLVVDAIATFVLDKLFAVAEKASVTNTTTFIARDNTSLGRITTEKLKTFIASTIWPLESVSPITSAELPLSSGASHGVLTLGNLVTFIKEQAGSDLLSLSSLDSISVLDNGDYLMVSKSGVSKKITWQDVVVKVNASLHDYILSTNGITGTPANDNAIPITASGSLRHITFEQLANVLGKIGFTGNAPTVNHVPQWASTEALKAGVPIVKTVTDIPSDNALVSERFVRNYIGQYPRVILTARDFVDNELLEFPHDSATSYSCYFRIPDGWDAGEIRARVVWFPGAGAITGKGMKLLISITQIVEGSAISGIPTAEEDIIDFTTGGEGIVHISPICSDMELIGPSPYIKIEIERDIAFNPPEGTVDTSVTVVAFELEYGRGMPLGGWDG
jgi:hypothetical protein